MAHRRRNAPRDFPRTARVGELLREILGDELERYDDDRLDLVSVTSVEVNQELSQAVVYFDSLAGAEGDDEVLAALAEKRTRLQAAVARQARLRRTPELSFRPDPGVRDGWRVEAILATLERPANAPGSPAGPGADAPGPERGEAGTETEVHDDVAEG